MNATISRIMGAPLRMSASGGKMARNPANFSTTDKTDLILYGYFRTLMEICQDASIELDLTYRTIQNFPRAIAYVSAANLRNTTPEQKLETVGKIIGIYGALLAVNMHDMSLVYEDLEQIRRNLPIVPFAMASLGPGAIATVRNPMRNVSVNVVDLGRQCLRTPDKQGSGCFIELSLFVKDYKKLTGVDLGEYGIEDLLVNMVK